jgi:hypothetical protein
MADIGVGETEQALNQTLAQARLGDVVGLVWHRGVGRGTGAWSAGEAVKKERVVWVGG